MQRTANEGIILQIQKFSVHDGQGVRTVIFMAGCPLRCKWCSNPETWDLSPKLAFYAKKCAGCGICCKTCPKSIFPPQMKAGDNCDACGLCANACPMDALAVLCEKAAADDVVRKIERDAVFFRYSKGGVTFSGGEPTMQEEFLRGLTERLYSRGVSMWIETCGHFCFEDVRDIFQKMDNVYYDIKCIDGRLHKELTGVDNAGILANSIRLHKLGLPITVRLPAIGGVNFTEGNLNATALFMSENLQGAAIEILPYHNFGKEKYEALKLTEYLHEFTTPEKHEISGAYSLFRRYGIEAANY